MIKVWYPPKIEFDVAEEDNLRENTQFFFFLNMKNHKAEFIATTAAAAKSLQSCPTLCDPIDGSPPGSPIPGILQARTLEWVAVSFSNA